MGGKERGREGRGWGREGSGREGVGKGDVALEMLSFSLQYIWFDFAIIVLTRVCGGRGGGWSGRRNFTKSS